MNRNRLLTICIVVAAGIFLTSPIFAQMGMDGMGMMKHSIKRHRHFMMNRISEQYRNLENPVPKTEKNIQEGGKLYKANCASCHGVQGLGDGPAGKQLNPPPSDIASIMRMPMMATDPYLFWTISDGGTELRTPMPAFKETFSPDEIWKIILYLREGLSLQ